MKHFKQEKFIMTMFIVEYHDISRIAKLKHLTDPKTFWDDVRKLVKMLNQTELYTAGNVLRSNGMTSY